MLIGISHFNSPWGILTVINLDANLYTHGMCLSRTVSERCSTQNHHLSAVAIAIGLTGGLTTTLIGLGRFRLYGVIDGLAFMAIASWSHDSIRANNLASSSSNSLCSRGDDLVDGSRIVNV